MSNKFLDIYPQLREPQVGDIVEVISVPYHSIFSYTARIKDQGEIIRIDSTLPKYLIRKLNDGVLYEYDEGTYWLDFEHFKVIKTSQQ